MVPGGSGMFKACRACQRRRVRCNGQQPCQRCQAKGAECVFDKRPLETKANLRSFRDDLQDHQRATEILLQALVSGDHDEAALITQLRNEPVERIAERLTRSGSASSDAGGTTDREGQAANPRERRVSSPGDQHPDSIAHFDATHPGRSPFSTAASSRNPYTPQPGFAFTGTRPDGSIADASEASFHQAPPSDSRYTPEPVPSASAVSVGAASMGGTSRSSGLPNIYGPSSSLYLHQTTTGTNDGGQGPVGDSWDNLSMMRLPYHLVCEFIDTFFSQHYEPFPAIYQNTFVQDFMSGARVNCSSALVRSIACLACYILGGYRVGHTHYASMGDRLFGEALRLLMASPEPEYSAPDIQALGLLALRHVAYGELAEARSLADESLKRSEVLFLRQDAKRNVDQIQKSMAATALCGSIALCRILRLIIGYLSDYNPWSRPGGVAKKSVAEPRTEIDTQVELRLMQSHSSPKDLQHIPSMVFQLADWVYCFASRSQIKDGADLPKHLLDTYQACLSWYDSALNTPSDAQEPISPFVHLFYHFCLLSLFRPFCDASYSHPDVSPVDICVEASGAILSLARTSNDMGRRHTSCFTPLFVHAAGLSDNIVKGKARAGSALLPVTSSGQGVASLAGQGMQGGLAALSGVGHPEYDGSLATRAAERLVTLSDIYPSASKSIEEYRVT